MGSEAKPKRTKTKREDIENDDSLRRFNREMELCKVSVSDQKHPLGDYPENHLLATLRHIAFDGEKSSINLLIRTYFECYGYEVSQQTVSGWLRDSRSIPRHQLARIIDLFSRLIVTGYDAKMFEDVIEIADDSPFEEPTLDDLYRVAFRNTVISLFRMTRKDKERVMRSAVLSDVMALDADELLPLVATIRLLAPSGGCASAFTALTLKETVDGANSQEVIRGLVGHRRNVEEAIDWAQGCSLPQPEPDFGPLPF